MPEQATNQTQLGTLPTQYNSFSSIFKAIPLEIKEDILQVYKQKGTFGKWAKADRQAMADAIIQTEDILELRYSAKEGRLLELRMELREIRRRLENALNEWE